MAEAGCYRPRYLNIQRLNYLWTIRHSSARIAGNLITSRDCRRGLARAYPLCTATRAGATNSVSCAERPDLGDEEPG
jgi:hypothetical protein